VEVSVNLEKGRIMLIDTAGLGRAKNILEKRIMAKTRELLEEVDYKILLIDGTGKRVSLNEADQYNMKIFTKSDLPGFKAEGSSWCVSSKTGAGINKLMDHLNRELFVNLPLIKEEAVITSERQYYCLKEAMINVGRALECLVKDPAVEILAFEIREARNRLAELFGEYNPEETLNAIFSSYCIGK